ncbi:MAG: hypothetical protein WCJ08_01995 [bacterium]
MLKFDLAWSRIGCIGLVVALMLLPVFPAHAEGRSSLNPRCATLGKKYLVAGKTFTCVLSGGKLILSKGVVVVAVPTSTTTTAPTSTTATLPISATTATSALVVANLLVGATDPATGGTIISDAGVGKTISVGQTTGRFVVVAPLSCEYKSTWSAKIKNGYSCGGKSDWDVPTLSMYFNNIFPVVDPPVGSWWTKENGTETDVKGVYGGIMISNASGYGVKGTCTDRYSCSGSAAKYNVLQVRPVRAFTP